MKSLSYKLGDVVRWWHRAAAINREPEYSYGLMVKDAETITGGKYFYKNVPPPGVPSMMCLETTIAITVFSFKEQRVIILYQSPEEPPLKIELLNSLRDS
jgi:hypothetical protein